MYVIWALVLLYGLLARPAEALGPRQWVVEDEGVLFALYGQSLLRFDTENQDWSSIPLPPEMAGRELLELFVQDGILWLATEDMVANADTRYYDWIVFPCADGAPLPQYAGMVFGEDCVWVAGEKGLGKLDQYTEEWTLYPMEGDTLTHLGLLEGEVWMCAGTKVIRFDPQYEKVRAYDAVEELTIPRVEWMKKVGEELWFFGSGAVARYNPDSETWRAIGTLPGRTVELPTQVVDQGELVWLLFRDGFVVFDTENEAARRPSWAHRIEGKEFFDIALYQGKLHITSDRLVSVFSPSGTAAELKGDLTFPGEVDGLTKTPLTRLSSTGGRLVGIGDGFLSVYLDEDDEWKVGAPPPAMAQTRRDGPYVRLGDNGLEVASPLLPKVNLLGSYTYIEQAYRSSDGIWDVADRHRIRLSGRSGRVSFFYDNTDLLLGDRWGGRYKGESEDHIREIGGGWGRIQPELADLLGESGYRGGWFWGESGGRGEKRHRRALQLRGWAGELTTGHAEEFFRGGNESFSLSRGKIVIGTVRLYLDDELLEEGEYTLDHSTGSFFLSFRDRDLVTEDSVLRVIYDYWLEDDDNRSNVAVPQLMLNHGDKLSFALSSLYREEEVDDTELISGAMRYRSDPDAAVRVSVENETLYDMGENAFGDRASISCASERFEIRLAGVALDSTIHTTARSQSEYGSVENEIEFTGRIEPSRELPIMWRAARKSTGSSEGKEGSGRVLWAKNRFPSLNLELAGRQWEGDTLSSTWKKTEIGCEYNGSSVPGFEKFWFQSRVRESEEETGDKATRYRNGLIRLDASPGGMADLSLLAWGRRADNVGEREDGRISGQGYGRATFWSSSLINGLNLYVRGDGRVVTSRYEQDGKDVDLNRTVLSSAVWRPGRAPLELEGTYSRTLSDKLTGVEREDGLFDYLDCVSGVKDIAAHRTSLIGGGSVFYLPRQSSLRIRATTTKQTGTDSSGFSSYGEQITIKGTLDLLPRSKNRWLLESSGTSSDTDGGDDTRKLSLWGRWERRWRRDLLSRVSFSASDDKTGENRSWSWSPGLYLQLGPDPRGIEVRGEVVAGKSKSPVHEMWFVRSTFRLEVRAMGAFLIRAEARPEIQFPIDGDPETTLLLNLKAGADF